MKAPINAAQRCTRLISGGANPSGLCVTKHLGNLTIINCGNQNVFVSIAFRIHCGDGYAVPIKRVSCVELGKL